MAGQQRYSSSADMYPPLRQSASQPLYDPVSYAASAATSRDYLSEHTMAGAAAPGSPHLGYGSNSHAGDSTAFLAGGHAEKYSDAGAYDLDGPPAHMLRSHGGQDARKPAASRRKRWLIIGGVLLLVAIAAGVVGGVVAARRSDSGSNDASNLASEHDKGAGDAVRNSAITGGNGSEITMEDGTKFTYVNNFGGHWVATPFSNDAQPNSWTKPLNQSWDYTNDKIYGVNIGGWLVLEPFIVPSAFEPYENDTEPAVDEFTLMGKYGDQAVARMTEHYETFITERDFAEIAGAGLNWIRLVMPFWMVETVEGEPYVEGVAWKYVLKGIAWARKYGLRVNLDLHTIPGSQNAWNHSGRQGSCNFLNGTNGIFNAERALNYIRTITEFFDQPEYRGVVEMFSIINEPQVGMQGNETLSEFYLEAYSMMRNITGTGEGNGMWIAFHDGFRGLPGWHGFLSGSDRAAMDQHNYLAFSTPSNDSLGYTAGKPCAYWAANYNNSMNNFGFSFSGEFSLAVTDCGEYLNNVGNGARYDGTYIAPGSTTPTYQAVGSCTEWNDWQAWTDDWKASLRTIALAEMDAVQNWFFWTWKIGNSTKTGYAPNPMWNYKVGLEQGWMPADPRDHVGVCASVIPAQGFAALDPTATFTAFPSPWMTGGAGAGTIAADQIASYGQWPPTSMREPVGTLATNLPRYTYTGTPITLSATTPTAYPSGAATVAVGNGWADPSDVAAYATPIAGCTYPQPYSGVNVPVPTTASCGA